VDTVIEARSDAAPGELGHQREQAEYGDLGRLPT
jgi:hypothetical protein